MIYQVTEIDFDFDTNDDEFYEFVRGIMIDEILITSYEAEDEYDLGDHLLEHLTKKTGRCIKSLQFKTL